MIVPMFPEAGLVLSSTSTDRRYKGSSGGVASELVEQCFQKGIIRSALGFHFTAESLFVPKIIYQRKDYEQVGSIYHHVDIIRYLTEHINDVERPLLLTCLPCQAKFLRSILTQHHIEGLLVSLVCSGQLTKEATYFLLRRNNIDPSQVVELRYRGKGWPSGIQVTLRDGTEYSFDNLRSEWHAIYHSAVFNLKKCFCCNDTFGGVADVSVGDPWLPKYLANDKIGSTLTLVHTNAGAQLISSLIEQGALRLHEVVSRDMIIKSQAGTLRKKAVYRANKRLIHLLRRIYGNRFYHQHVFSAYPRLHQRFHSFVIRGLSLRRKSRYEYLDH